MKYKFFIFALIAGLFGLSNAQALEFFETDSESKLITVGDPMDPITPTPETTCVPG